MMIRLAKRTGSLVHKACQRRFEEKSSKNAEHWLKEFTLGSQTRQPRLWQIHSWWMFMYRCKIIWKWEKKLEGNG